MMFIVRTSGDQPTDPQIRVKVVRRTPTLAARSAAETDFFCVGEAEAARRLREQGFNVVDLRDGWYADDAGGGVAIWGQGKYWEVRTTPFQIKEAVGPGVDADANGAAADGVLNIRKAILGGV